MDGEEGKDGDFDTGLPNKKRLGLDGDRQRLVVNYAKQNEILSKLMNPGSAKELSFKARGKLIHCLIELQTSNCHIPVESETFTTQISPNDPEFHQKISESGSLKYLEVWFSYKYAYFIINFARENE